MAYRSRTVILNHIASFPEKIQPNIAPLTLGLSKTFLSITDYFMNGFGMHTTSGGQRSFTKYAITLLFFSQKIRFRCFLVLISGFRFLHKLIFLKIARIKAWEFGFVTQSNESTNITSDQICHSKKSGTS